MEYQATSKYLRTGPRKLRLLVDGLKKLTPLVALGQLSALPQAASKELANVISSALANAKEKQAKEELLTFKSIDVMGAGAMKRFRAVSRGQAHTYKKRMSHVRVILTDENKKVVSVT